MNIEFGTHTLKGYISFNSRKKKRVAGIETPSGFSKHGGRVTVKPSGKRWLKKAYFYNKRIL